VTLSRRFYCDPMTAANCRAMPHNFRNEKQPTVCFPMALPFDDDESTGSIYTTRESSDHDGGLDDHDGNRRDTLPSFSTMTTLSMSSSSLQSQRSLRTMSRIRQLLDASSADCESSSTSRPTLLQAPGTPPPSEKWRAKFTRQANDFEDPRDMFLRDVSEEASESSIRDFLSIGVTEASARAFTPNKPPIASSAEKRQGSTSSFDCGCVGNSSFKYPFLRKGVRGSGTRARLSKALSWRKNSRK
jgi:hypothetical protein